MIGNMFINLKNLQIYRQRIKKKYSTANRLNNEKPYSINNH
ncbi:MAG: hypothetical protein ACD_75C00939G0002 [uncultured bacterium]|nr:MAG: hypothetical protein ACD_75C00939G0002 [uncultured bacterium]